MHKRSSKLLGISTKYNRENRSRKDVHVVMKKLSLQPLTWAKHDIRPRNHLTPCFIPKRNYICL